MITPIHQKNLLYPVLVILTLIVAVFYNLGIYPLYLEEPRRALIALEMLYNDNLWVPTEFGVYYYKKPPLFNWVIIAGYKLFGNYSEFAVRFFSVVSYLIMGGVMFLMGKKYVNATFGVYSAFLFFICSDLLFYFTTTSGEIDLFYSMITYLSFVAIFHFYKKGNFWLLFVISYFLAALGTLTKGLPSIVFQGISILTLFLYFRDFKGLFRISHAAGILVYILIVGGYALIYSQYNDPSQFIFSKDSIVSQSMERTPFENGIFKVLIHLLAFPLELIKILAPGSLLLLLFLSKRSRRSVISNDHIRFSLILLAANIWIYWISPGTASRYLYMFFPLAISVLIYPLFDKHGPTIIRVLKYLFLSLIILFGLTSLALPFIPDLEKIDHLLFISVIFGFSFAAMAYLFIRLSQWRMMTMIASFVLMRLLFDLVMLPIRTTDMLASEEKAIAEDIYSITGDDPIHIYKSEVAFRSTIFYLERATQKVLTLDSMATANHFYLAEIREIPRDRSYETLYTFEHKGGMFGLIRFKDE